jgi:hypothetical protein
MWISKERYDTLLRNGKWNAEERKADDEWFRTHAAQLKAIADSQKQLEVNVAERLAALESKSDNLHGIIESNAMSLAERLPTKLFAECADLGSLLKPIEAKLALLANGLGAIEEKAQLFHSEVISEAWGRGYDAGLDAAPCAKCEARKFKPPRAKPSKRRKAA